jgi:hypothetical protein
MKLTKYCKGCQERTFGTGWENGWCDNCWAKKQTEKGEASILIELKKGDITIYHGDQGDILLEKKNVEGGSWDKIWDTLKAIKENKETIRASGCSSCNCDKQ